MDRHSKAPSTRNLKYLLPAQRPLPPCPPLSPVPLPFLPCTRNLEPESETRSDTAASTRASACRLRTEITESRKENDRD